MPDQDIFDTIIRLKNKAILEFGGHRHPRYIYVGHEELVAMLKSPRHQEFMNISLKDNRDDKVMGMELFEVNRKNHLYISY